MKPRNMVDLNDMLLEAAGRIDSRPSNRRWHKVSYSDDESDSADDDSDYDSGYAGRKPSDTQDPLKRRLSPTEQEKVYKGEEDRRRLVKMAELQREMILAGPATRRNYQNLKNTTKKEKEKSNQSRKDSPPPHTAGRAEEVTVGKSSTALHPARMFDRPYERRSVRPRLAAPVGFEERLVRVEATVDQLSTQVAMLSAQMQWVMDAIAAQMTAAGIPVAPRPDAPLPPRDSPSLQ